MMRPTIPLIVIIGSDPGAARALLPVILELEHGGKVVCKLLAYKQATSIWRQKGLNVEEVDENLAGQEAYRQLRDCQARLLLCGTSYNQAALENRYIKASQAMDLPSLALLDFWSNYTSRFRDGQGSDLILPSKIAIMDEMAYQDMIDAGFDPARLVITGQPVFDDLARLRSNQSPYLVDAIRAGLGIEGDELFILFASQPLGEYYNMDPDRPGYLGYTERDVVNLLVQALDLLVERYKRKIRLILRPHPRERIEWMKGIEGKKVTVQICTEGKSLYLAMAANLVVGMNTILLMESCYLGCPVVSLQPGLLLPDPLPTNRAGFSRGVYRSDEILPVIEGLLFDEAVQRELRDRLAGMVLPDGSTDRVVRLAYQMMDLER